MKPYILTVTLNPAVDKTVIVPHFRIGRDFREQAISISAGGKGINVSRVLKHLGVASIVSGFLGGTDGQYIRQKLNKEKIEYDFCPIKNNTRTSLTIIDPALNTITRVLERGPGVTKKELSLFRKKFLSLLGHCGYVVFSGRNIPGAPDSFYGELIAIAKRKNIISVLDTSGRPLGLGIKQKPFMIKPNLHEAEQVLGRELSSLTKIKAAVSQFHQQGVEVVAITLGSRGALVSCGKEMIMVTPPRLVRKSPVGCGDAFIGGFIAEYARKRHFAECVRMAVACGAANVRSINPGFIKPQTLQRIFKQVKLRCVKAAL